MVTLEDVVEEILQDKIADGTDSAEARRERKSCADRITLDYGTIFDFMAAFSLLGLRV